MLHPNTLYSIVRFLIIVFIGGILMGVGYWYLSDPYNAETEAFETKVELERFVATAEVRRGRIGTYDGICADLLLPDTITCHGTRDQFALETRLTSGDFMCVDNTGVVVTHLYSKQSNTECPE